ncbi:PREDICTED: intraflagellar transport protein osm-1 [Papilio xuthus]|uniref:Intraflagellar transport protein osm-1 n=1 Tax=Papilio xuthus TaxID=66420 RepID=A0AAJ6ZH96_PAPXU|nr:PREDICTED: intraflagellar transport protein osm-1 [Papilio xuthus]
MRFKYSKTLLESQGCDSPIADLSWSPNNVKLAVATCERQILLFDLDGTRRDKFSTKPADAAAGKKSYVITSISFSENSELLGVAQSDNMVFVYRVGADWSGKKVICNKFSLSGAPLKLLTGEAGFFTGTSDGKIRSLDCKSNKSSSMWSAGSCCVALARCDAALASGHIDGSIYLNGRMLLRYALPPTALLLLLPYLIVGSCDGRISMYEAQRGALLRSLEPQLPPDRRDFIAVAASPSGQTIAFGVFDGCLVGEVKESGNIELSPLHIPHLYATRALAWSGDGTRLALASQTGAVIQLEAVLRRWVWRDSVEVQHVSPRQLLLRRLAGDAPPLAVTTNHAHDIFNVRFIGNDWYAVCRTNTTLILCDIARGLTSEIAWSGSGERIYAAVGGACLLHRAGELSVVEYGLDKVLHTVRTERVNPHVLSVRVNEGPTQAADRKHLAYLLDKQTVAVLDLVSGVQVGQWWHEARVDWLELNESARLLLYRDTRRNLTLLRLDTAEKETIARGVSFVQWIENSDAVVAQTHTHLLIWYSAWEPGSVETVECEGGIAVEVSARRVLLEGGQLPYVQLDEHRLAFNSALDNGDLTTCAKYLEGVGGSADVTALWRQLADTALNAHDIQLAAKCYREAGDEARSLFLDNALQLAATEGDGDVAIGLSSPVVQAELCILAGNLSEAAECYVRRAGQPRLALDMYRRYNVWSEAIALAEKHFPAEAPDMKRQYMDYLMSTGRVGEAGEVLAAGGEVRGAVRLWLRGGRVRRAATALLAHASLLRDDELVHAVHTQLVQEEWWELAGEMSEKRGDSKAAVEYYARGHNYARAVQLARESCPEQVTVLEGAWGAWLAGARQAGAAVPHLIEAGDTRAALHAALKAHLYKKALQIVQVIDDKESIREQCEQLGDHFISTQDWETAENVLTSSNMAERCVKAYNTASRIADGLRVAATHLTEEQTRDIYLPLAQQLREEGQLRKAEQIYIALGEPDEAISMYKEASQYEAMLRLVAAHRSSLLEATRRHVAQALHASGDLRAAETYYIQAGEWKSAVQMYKSSGQWENAERVARAHGPATAQHQVALQWAATLPPAAAARMLAARGLAVVGARWALQAQRWDIASELSEVGGGVSRREVARHEAAALAAEQPENAEAAYLRAAAPEDAVRMWLDQGEHQRALRIAETHAAHMVEEVLVEGARAAAERGDLAQFEALMIRANRPAEVVQHYRDLEMWEDASRVSREYLPDSAEPVPAAVPPLLRRAADHADRGEWWEAVQLLLGASAAGAAGGALRLAERAALRAARLARDHLEGARRRAAADMLAERFTAIDQSEVGEQLRAALTEGDLENASGVDMSEEEEEEVVPVMGERGVVVEGGEVREGTEGAALEKLARAGHWQRCLAHAGRSAPHYALRHAAYIFNAHSRIEGVNIESEEVPEGLAEALESLRQYLVSDGEAVVQASDVELAGAVCRELLVRVSTAPQVLQALKDAAAIMLAAGADDRSLQAITLLMGLHVPQIAGKVARALPRYTDIIVADVAFLRCGVCVRAEGATSTREAFVLLNHCLDLAEAADDSTQQLLSFSDFEVTDWPQNRLLLEKSCISGAPLQEAREWVLSVVMDQDVEQALPVDSRALYAASVTPDEPCCVLTGYPLGSRLVTFSNGRCANREWWSRCKKAAAGGAGGAGGGGAAGALLQHVASWCGPPDTTNL